MKYTKPQVVVRPALAFVQASGQNAKTMGLQDPLNQNQHTSPAYEADE